MSCYSLFSACLSRARLPLTSVVLLAISACGGGGGSSPTPSSPGNSSSSSSAPPPVFNLTTQISGSGTLLPVSQSIGQGQVASFTLSPASGHELSSVTGCPGSLAGLVFTTNPIAAACTLSASFVPVAYSLGGNVSGLLGNVSLNLQLGAEQESLTLSANSAYSFQRDVFIGEGYQVSLTSQPAGQECSLSNEFGVVAASNIGNINVSCISLTTTASLSGKITAAADLMVDSTLNDIVAPFANNTSPFTPQIIPNRATLHGFVSAEPTGGDAQLERFASVKDEDDFFRTSLQVGQVIQLQVVDFEGFDLGSTFEGDLDLYLFNLQGEMVRFSNGVEEYEELVVPANGEYLINVWAYTGTSKYVLRLLPPTADSVQQSAPLEFVPHEMIVGWEKSTSVASLKQGTQGLDLSHTNPGRETLVRMPAEPLEFTGAGVQKGLGRLSEGAADLHELSPEGYAQRLTLAHIKAMGQQPGVSYAEPNYIRRSLSEPNDPGYLNQWHYRNINLPQAWDITIGTRPAGQEVIVAVVDTGVFLAHPDLAGQLVSGYDFISNSSNAADGGGIDPNPDDPGDSSQRGRSSWHGTHVAGTIAAASNNNSGLAGVAWGARIMPIRVLGRQGGSSYDIIQGLRYAAGLANDSGTLPSRRADIANLSLGGGQGSLAEQQAYAAARATGMIIVAAAGNDNSSAPSYPAAYPAVISVGATDFLNQRAHYSNFGSSLSLVAPGGRQSVDLSGDGYGDGVLSTFADDASGTRVAAFSFQQGTSMAAPHVAGVLALMKALHPGLTPDIADNLIQTGSITDDLGTPGRDNTYGYGLINAFKAVRAAADLADGAALPEWPVQLQATPASVNLGLTGFANLVIANLGGGDPQITGVTSNSAWLTASPSASVNARGLGTYQMLVNRGGLNAGLYQGQLSFAVAGRDPLLVQVSMQVGAVAGGGDLAPLYVLLIDPETREALYQTSPQRQGDDWHYSFAEIPVGDYLVTAGSDIDVDYFICQSGESCGAYPSLALREPVQVRGVNLTGLDMVVDVLASFPATAGLMTGLAEGEGVRRKP